MPAPDEILDPAHDPDVVIAGIAKPDTKDGDKPDFKASEDGNIVEHGGKKYITMDALTSERAQRQKLAETLSALEPVLPDFEEFLKTRNTRRQSVRDGASGGNDDAAYLNEVAIALGLYDETNQPDHRRAQAHLNITRREAQRAAGDAVGPVNAQNTKERARANRERAKANNFVDGQPVAEAKYMDAALEAVGEEQLADPNVANLVQVVAAGLQFLDERKNGRTRRSSGGGREPMMVERGSGRFDSEEGEISSLDRAAARARGKTPEQWAKISKQVNNDRRNPAVLEDL